MGHDPAYMLKVNLDETGLKFKPEVEAVTAPYKVYKDMQKAKK
jgi:hypothetical protein